MIDIIRHEELGGGCTMRPWIILDAADLRSCGGLFEVAALSHDGGELEKNTAADEAAAIAEFDRLVQKYAEPLQRSVNAAGLVPGHRYTLVYLNDFGFPATLAGAACPTCLTNPSRTGKPSIRRSSPC